jgi:hypothetical protein
VTAVEILPLMIVDATFRPRRTDDLRAEAEPLIGWRGRWQAGWIIDEGPYAGEWHMAVVDPVPLPFAWAPSGDLDIHGISGDIER